LIYVIVIAFRIEFLRLRKNAIVCISKEDEKVLFDLERLNYFSLTEQGLGPDVHSHLGWTKHLCFNTETSLDSCIDRFTEELRGCYRIIRALSYPGLDGVCNCVVGIVSPLPESKIKPCIYTVNPGGIKISVSRFFHIRKLRNSICQCKVSSYLEIGRSVIS